MKMGELFAGYGGLGMGVQAVIPDAELAWVSEIDRGANKILEYRFPGVPNIGDITTVDWAQVEPVDILTGGSPCQDLSHAGARKGMTEGTRSNLWVAMREAIAQLRPSLVVWENVEGAASAPADSDLEFCPGCMGEARDGGAVLRALGRVVGDLSSLGYVGRGCSIRAADVGAPHGRRRRFLVAYPASRGWREGRPEPTRLIGRPDAAERGDVALLPTPAVNDMGEGKTPEVWDEWTAKMQAAHGNGNGHGKSLAIEAQRLLPTPTVEDRKASGARGYGGDDFSTLTDAAVRNPQDWGVYADAITRWETLTRPAPPPTQPSKKGTPQLSPAFSEWMMGLPDGWVTGVPGITRNEALKAIGNGVCPQQAATALRFLLGAITPPMQASTGLLPTPGTLDHIEKRTTHAGGNLTLQGALSGVNPIDAARHADRLPAPQSRDVAEDPLFTGGGSA